MTRKALFYLLLFTLLSIGVQIHAHNGRSFTYITYHTENQGYQNILEFLAGSRKELHVKLLYEPFSASAGVSTGVNLAFLKAEISYISNYLMFETGVTLLNTLETTIGIITKESLMSLTASISAKRRFNDAMLGIKALALIGHADGIFVPTIICLYGGVYLPLGNQKRR